MVKDVYTTFAKREGCVQYKSRYDDRQAILLFSVSGALDLVEIHIFGQLPKTNQCNQYTCVMTDQYFKQTLAILMSKALSMHMENKFLGRWTVRFGIPTYLVADT